MVTISRVTHYSTRSNSRELRNQTHVNRKTFALKKLKHDRFNTNNSWFCNKNWQWFLTKLVPDKVTKTVKFDRTLISRLGDSLINESSRQSSNHLRDYMTKNILRRTRKLNYVWIIKDRKHPENTAHAMCDSTSTSSEARHAPHACVSSQWLTILILQLKKWKSFQLTWYRGITRTIYFRKRKNNNWITAFVENELKKVYIFKKGHIFNKVTE